MKRSHLLSLAGIAAIIAFTAGGIHAAQHSTSKGQQQDVEIASDSHVRLAAGSSIDHTKKKSITLNSGAMLVEDTAGFTGRGTTVETAEATTKVKGGSFVAEYQSGGYLKIICLAGEVTVQSKSLFAEFIELVPGKMLIISPSDKQLPNPVDIDLERFISSSRLVGNGSGSMANADKVNKALAKQGRDEAKGRTTKSAVVLPGRGLEVGFDVAYSAGSPAFVQNALAAPPPEVVEIPEVEQPMEPRPDGGGSSPLIDYVLNSNTVFNAANGTIQTPGFPELTRTDSGDYYYAQSFQVSGNINLSSFTGRITFLGYDSFQIGVAGPTTILLGQSSGESFWFDTYGNETVTNTTFDVAPGSQYEVDFWSFDGNLDVSNSNITAHDLDFYAGNGVVTMSNTVVNAKDLHTGARVSVDGSTISLNNVDVGQGTPPDNLSINSPNSITITNSSDLQALVSVTMGSPNITIANGTIQAPDGSVNLNAVSNLDLTNVNIAAQNVNLAATGPNGLMYIKGGSVYAAQVLSLLGDSSSGTIRFGGGAVSLTGETINISAHRVEIDNGTTVNNTAGPGGTNVSATIKNYNTMGYGSFSVPPP